jgi:uncharacterized glyoxalase superfamily protein PhnB
MPAPQDPTQASAIPVLSGVVPYLQVENAKKTAEFYERAFGAETMFHATPDEKGRTMHIHLHLNGGSLMLVDSFPEYGHPHQQPQAYTLHMRVDDIDAKFERAVAAGCTVKVPVQKMFWGERYGQLVDPFGVNWSMGQPNA